MPGNGIQDIVCNAELAAVCFGAAFPGKGLAHIAAGFTGDQ
jgi:hypothetical protein